MLWMAFLFFFGSGWFDQTSIKLEVQADRVLLGPERTGAVIASKGPYTWIYKTVLEDEARISTVVRKHHLDYKAKD